MRSTEKDWVARAQRGNERAYRFLFDAHADRLFRFLRQFSRDRAETQDWVQRAFIKAFERLQQFDARSSFATWLFRIGLNEMNMDRRKMHLVDLQEDLSEEPAHQFEPADEFLWHHTMHEWLNQLDTTKRTVFLLHEVEGFSHAEIEKMLSISASHSRTILTRARQNLKDQWEKEQRAQ